ncbi:flagellin [Sphingomonas sp.]|uniref:flagellin N-terminal helical domain-containing protein n=1 Tax=Sphingomonas sp. TaxID=28214 RepID=UPI0025D0C848|nr:flagellin [Sphingomonas sp.]
MRVTTSQTFDRPSLLMANLNREADRLQTQVATGKKIQAPSDSAPDWQRLSTLSRAAADDTAYTSNAKLAQSLLADSDASMSSIETQLQRAKEIAVQANSDTLSPEARSQLKDQVDAIITDILNLANAKDTRGQPLFAGASGDTAYARQGDGSIAYVGGGEASTIPIANGVSVQATQSGARVFAVKTDSGDSDVFAILSAFSAALATDAPQGGIDKALGELDSALDSVGTVRSSIGARAYGVDLELNRLSDANVARETERSGIEDADTTESIAQLQKTLTILQATQASFTKLTSLSLFDYLR